MEDFKHLPRKSMEFARTVHVDYRVFYRALLEKKPKI